MAAHCRLPARRIGAQRSLAGCSPWGRRVGHDGATEHAMLDRYSAQLGGDWPSSASWSWLLCPFDCIFLSF